MEFAVGLALGLFLGLALGVFVASIYTKRVQGWLVTGADLYRAGMMNLKASGQKIQAVQMPPDDLDIEESETFAKIKADKEAERIRQIKEGMTLGPGRGYRPLYTAEGEHERE